MPDLPAQKGELEIVIKKEVIATGATTEEAIENGCRELGMDREDVSFEVIELPKSKMLGLFGGADAKVRVYVESSPGDLAAEYLGSIIEAMGLTGVKIEVEENEEENGASLNLTGEGLGTIIGRRGETLAALQYLVSLAANNSEDEYYRIAINIGNYREKRESSLENLAKKTAARSVKINKNLALDPMNPYERRIIHTAVQEVEGATSWSVGEGVKRHVVIGPVGLDEGGEGLLVNHNNNRGNNRGGRGGYNNRGRNNNRGGYNNRGRNNNRGGYNNRGRNNNRGSYNNSYNNNSGEQREVRRDTTAPLYGRIEVPKKTENNEE